jgi:hypothetical protein
MKRTVACLAALGIIFFVEGGPGPEDLEPTTVATITEDSPQWDCRTMGNHVCGTAGPVEEEPVWVMFDNRGMPVGAMVQVPGCTPGWHHQDGEDPFTVNCPNR